MLDFHPKAQMRFISVEEALHGIKPDYIRLPHPGQQWAVKLTKPGEALSKYHPHGYWFSYIRLPKNKPAPTLQKSQADKIYHYSDDRIITIKEAARLASFPDAFQFVGKIGEAWDRIGNSVPPRFMYALAMHIYISLLSRLEQSPVAQRSGATKEGSELR